MAPLAEIENALTERLPRGLACAVTDPAENWEAAFDEEAAVMAQAVPKRRTEFFAGRAAAHRATEKLGRNRVPIGMGQDRAPIWPEGVVGSISHCEGLCVALVGEAAIWRAVAVDVEPDADLPNDVWDEVLLPAERAELSALPAQQQGRRARQVFSAKEAVFKLQYPTCRKWLGFGDVQIEFDDGGQRFGAQIDGKIGAEFCGVPVSGHAEIIGAFMFSVMFSAQ